MHHSPVQLIDELIPEQGGISSPMPWYLARLCAEGHLALLAVHRGDLAVADSLVGDAEPAVSQVLSDSHLVAMFPALARAQVRARSRI